jgi:nucleoside-diphosphate-sugar epimerase
MRIFLTGATGYVGSAILEALVRAGHDVTALVRTTDKAARVSARGAHPVLGDLAEPDSYRGAADAHDGYVHAAYDSTPGRGPDIDRAAIETLLSAAQRPRTAGAAPVTRFVIYTSTLPVLGRAPDPVDESAPVNPIALAAWRPAQEQVVLEAAGERLRTMVVRPGTVYGGGQGTVGDLFRAAANGLVRVVGDGSNRWPLVYDRDLADLYARLVAREDASGIFHASDEGDERVNDIVTAITPHMPVRPDVRYLPLEAARPRMGLQADALVLDQVVRGPRARSLGWTPSLRSVAGNVPRLLDEWRAAAREQAA